MFINNYSVRYIDLNSEKHKTNNQDFVKLPSAFLPDIISKGQVRRMSSASRNAISMCHELWPLGNQYKPFSFHIGTGLAMIQDTEKFLHALIAHKEEGVSPTQFIQSTHNTIGGQLALLYNSHAHNMTFSQGITSYIDAYKDAQYMANDFPNEDILCGAIDEINELAVEIYTAQNIHEDKIYTEGGAFFHLRKNANDDSVIEILNFQQISREELFKFLTSFEKNKLTDFIFFGNAWLKHKENINKEAIVGEKEIGFNASTWAIQKALACDLLIKSKKNQLIYLGAINENYFILHLKKCRSEDLIT
ncbi:MAG TPA: beta-ketoacyl synthase chain length factor [Chitinophagaceae bacterium]|nr:beta-ketoacyl synthase chain length factor [Chitinophagaceae bacterium]